MNSFIHVAYRLIALEITGKVDICLGGSRESKENYIYETPWDSVLDIKIAREEVPIEEEHAVFTHIVSHNSVPRPIHSPEGTLVCYSFSFKFIYDYKSVVLASLIFI